MWNLLPIANRWAVRPEGTAVGSGWVSSPTWALLCTFSQMLPATTPSTSAQHIPLSQCSHVREIQFPLLGSVQSKCRCFGGAAEWLCSRRCCGCCVCGHHPSHLVTSAADGSRREPITSPPAELPSINCKRLARNIQFPGPIA